MSTALSQLIGDYFFNSFASIKLIEQIILRFNLISGIYNFELH
ncbi:hypothetical protein [Candidatus Tisiphia endosymbiont of Nedyus quadrimaculatus]